MQKIAGELKRSLHMLSAELVAMVQDPEFEEALRHADLDDDIRALLMVEALKGIALDPLTGETPEAFYEFYGDTIAFNIQFDRWVNFIGLFDLPANSGRAKQVIEAIEANLKGKMFKAAKMHRRLAKRRKKRHGQAQARASRAYSAILTTCGGQFKSQEDRDRANAVYNQVFELRMGSIDDRINRVGDAAAPGFVGAYGEAVAKFLYWHLPFGTSTKRTAQSSATLPLA